MDFLLCLFYPTCMTISTVSFDKAKIFKNKMFFIEYGKNATSTKVFDCCGNNIINKNSYLPTIEIEGDKLVIIKKNEYEQPKNGIIFKTVKRIYDKCGNLLDVKKEFIKF